MTTVGAAPVPPPPREPTPLLKKTAPTAPTTSTESLASTGPSRAKSRGATTPSGHAGQQDAATPLHQRPKGPPQPRRSAARAAPGSDPLSERATTLLIRRTLCPQQGGGDKGRTPAPIEDLLPPLTSRNDVDLQLYAIIAIVLRDFVQTWYGKITPDDDFVAEIVQVIAHCTRALEQRLRKVDLESLLLDEMPELLSRHIDAYRIAHRPIVRPPLDANPRHIYHSLWPAPALSPVPSDAAAAEEQASNESAYRQLLAEGVLAVLLPTEDLENPCLTTLVGQILSELIIGGVVARKLSEPWLIWEIMASMARGKKQEEKKASSDAVTSPALASDARPPPPPTRTRNSTATPTPTTTTTPTAATTTPPESRPTMAGYAASLQQLFWSMVHTGFLAFALLRALVVTLATYRSVPSRLGVAVASHGRKGGAVTAPWAVETPISPATADKAPQPRHPRTKVPVAVFGIWTAASNLLEVEARMPWLRGCLSLAQWVAITGPGQLAGLDGPVDRLVSHTIARHLLNPAKLPPLLRSLRAAIFPNNAMGTQSLFPPSSEQELLALRRRCASSLRSLVPNGVARLYFGSNSNSGGTQIGMGTSTLLRTGPSTGGDGSPPDRGPDGQTRPSKSPQQHQQQHQQPASNLTGASNSAAADHMSTSRVGTTAGGPPAVIPGARLDDERIVAEIESGILDVFGDAYCNKHLMYAALELLLVRLMPELADRGVVDLWVERLS
ncbi:hypothetical protein RB601_006422 [Gaeumannomyces tritici]